MSLEKIRASAVLFIIGAYLIFNHGFMLIRVPPGGTFGIPLGELIILLFGATFLFEIRRWPSFATLAPITPLLIWWGVSFGRLFVDFDEHGVWALRDATHVIDSLFLWIGYATAASPQFFERFSQWLRTILNLGIFYFLLYPFRDELQSLSPKVWAPGGYSSPIFFTYNIGGLMVLTGAIRLLVDRVTLWRISPVVLAGVVIVFAAVMFQARTVYLQILAVFTVMMIVQPRVALNMSVSVLFGLMGLSVLLASGIEITGRLGENVSLDFFIQHFAAIWGAEGDGTVRGAAAGVSQRLGWWLKIWEDTTASSTTFLFGLGYGIPLTDFIFHNGAIVREPHNSVISVFARTGAIGLLAFLALHISLVGIWWRTYRWCKATGQVTWTRNLTIMGVFVVLVWIDSLGEDAFEKPYAAIALYFFWGVILRAYFKYRAYAGSNAIETSQPLAQPVRLAAS